MPYSKISPTTKKQAMDKLAAGMTIPDVAKMFSISTRTLNTWKAKQGVKASVPAAPSPSIKASEPAAGDDENVAQVKPTLEFEESPAPVDKKNVVDAAWESLKGMLGIADNKAAPAPPSAKLDAKRQQFVDSAAPTIALAFVAIAAYVWRRVDPDVAPYLAPSEEVALKIVTPLVRIYARHANFLTDVNPDIADVGAAAFALYGYVDSSIKLYRQIKEEQREYEENGQGNGGPRTYKGNAFDGREEGWREYRPGAYAENRARNQGDRQSAVPGRNGGNGQQHGADDGYPGHQHIPDLSDKEARAYAALSRLSQLDYDHRARRQGRA